MESISKSGILAKLFRQTATAFLCVALFGFVALTSAIAGDRDDDSASDSNGRGRRSVETIYVQTNDPRPNRNAILAYRHRRDGSLELVGRFPTRGTGTFNPTDRLGPDDHDQEIIISPDKRFLFTINQGSNTVAVFNIESNGVLTHVNGSPFRSGGNGPVSLGLAGDTLYVVNQNENTPFPSIDDPADRRLPNYSAFQVSSTGRLTRIPSATFTLEKGDTPTQALISPNGKHLFGNRFFAVPYAPTLPAFVPPRSSLLDSFRIQSSGDLLPAPGSPKALTDGAAPFPPVFMEQEGRYSLGLQVHPTERILYVGYLLGFKLAVYKYNNAGRLTFVTATNLVEPSDRTEGPLGLGICWIVINKDRTRAYVSNAISNSISVLNIEDPLAPVLMQSVPLKLESDAPQGGLFAFGPVNFATTPFQIALDPDSKTLYVKNHETTTPMGDAKFDINNGYANGNALHFLNVRRDGTLVEHPRSPEFLPIPAGAHATGLAVLEQSKRKRDDRDDCDRDN